MSFSQVSLEGKSNTQHENSYKTQVTAFYNCALFDAYIFTEQCFSLFDTPFLFLENPLLFSKQKLSQHHRVM